MSDLNPALSSLYDSLNGLFSRMASNDPNSLRVARIMLAIGEKISGSPQGGDAEIQTANDLAGRVSTMDPTSDDLEALLGAIEDFLATL